MFYGWIVLAASFAVTAILGATFSSFGVFFKPMEDEFSWSRSLVSSGFTAFLVGYAISAAITGRLADRHSPRPILLFSASLAGLGISLCSQTSSVGHFRLFALIAGLGLGAAFPASTSTVQRWFRNRRSAGMVLALIIGGFGLGQLALTPLVNQSILAYGWRTAYLIAGILAFAIIVICSLIMRQSPIEASGPWRRETAKLARTPARSTAKTVISPAYASIVYAACALSVAFQTVTIHLVPYATDLGMSSTVAAMALGLMGGISVPGRLISGPISSRIGWQKGLGLSLFGMGASLALLLLNRAGMLYGFVFLFGTFWGIGAVAQVGVLSEFFGLDSIGEIIGITSAISTFVGAAAPYLAGYIFDTTGSYFVAFAIVTVITLSGGLVATLAKKPSSTLK